MKEYASISNCTVKIDMLWLIGEMMSDQNKSRRQTSTTIYNILSTLSRTFKFLFRVHVAELLGLPTERQFCYAESEVGRVN